MEKISLIVGALLILIGLWGILTQKNIIKMIIGFSLTDTGLHVIIVSIGYMKGKSAPILDSAVGVTDVANKITDPLPQALVLTAIVIGLGVTALMLSYAMKLHKERGTLEIGSYEDLKW